MAKKKEGGGKPKVSGHTSPAEPAFPTVGTDAATKRVIASDDPDAAGELQDLLAAEGIGTLLLDSALRIKAFTPPFGELFNITKRDKGRLVADFADRLGDAGFVADAQRVSKTFCVIEREIATSGRRYLTRLRPYRPRGEGMAGVVATFIDLTDHLEAQEMLKISEARLRLLSSEFSHRLKNTLTVIQSMARQSFREDIPRPEALRRFSDRLRALSAAYDLVAAGNWSAVDLSLLTKRQLASVAGARMERIRIEGPSVLLPPDIATRFGLILHELATNAVIHGALSTPSGMVYLNWQFASGMEPSFLKVHWREEGAPPPVEPRKQGFGTFIIEQGLAEAEVERHYATSGLACTITIRLSAGPRSSL